MSGRGLGVCVFSVCLRMVANGCSSDARFMCERTFGEAPKVCVCVSRCLLLVVADWGSFVSGGRDWWERLHIPLCPVALAPHPVRAHQELHASGRGDTWCVA